MAQTESDICINMGINNHLYSIFEHMYTYVLHELRQTKIIYIMTKYKQFINMFSRLGVYSLIVGGICALYVKVAIVWNERKKWKKLKWCYSIFWN